MPHPSPAAHAGVLEAFARIGHAVGHPARLRILSLLGQAPRTVTVLADGCGESIANTSAHLAVLAEAGVVTRERNGRHIRYALAHDSVSALVTSIRTVAEAVHEPKARRHLAAFHGRDVAALTPRTLHERLRADVHLIDVRPEDEYAAGHLPGARSIPLRALRREEVVPTGSAPTLVYCRGRYCLGAVEGVRLLSRAGLDVRRLPFGVTEWRAAGFRLAVN